MPDTVKIKVDFNKVKGKIKPMHGVGQPPFVGMEFKMFCYLTEAGIPFSRLHDAGGWFGGSRYVDIPNLFPDFSADPDDPASYDFAFTDRLITALVKAGTEPFFRLGVTIENYAQIKAYRIFPPSDPLKWAKICEGVIRHYTEGWADGFRYGIRYWEIWNEPDNSDDPMQNQMWRGSMGQYFELYRVASRYLKDRFPHLKIGGYASCGFYAIAGIETDPNAKASARETYFVTFFEEFLKFAKENNCPLDFFSWHSYASIEHTAIFARYARKKLDEYGFKDTETTCNEWNYMINLRGTARHMALCAAMMLSFQRLPLDSAMFYDARLGVSDYASLFNPLTWEPLPAYEAFKSFNELYKRGAEVYLTAENAGGVYAAAAKGDDGVIMISNINETPVDLAFDCGSSPVSYRLISDGGATENGGAPHSLPANSVAVVKFKI